MWLARLCFQTLTSLFASMSLWMWKAKRSTWWTVAWPTTSRILSFCGHSAVLTSSSLLTFLRDPATPARPSRSLHIRTSHRIEDLFLLLPLTLCMCRSFFWLRNGHAWTSSHSLRLILKSSTVKAWKNVTSSSRGKVKRTVRPSSTLCWSTSTSGHSRHPVGICAELLTASVWDYLGFHQW